MLVRDALKKERETQSFAASRRQTDADAINGDIVPPHHHPPCHYQSHRRRRHTITTQPTPTTEDVGPVAATTTATA
jgi:hypothetical protein